MKLFFILVEVALAIGAFLMPICCLLLTRTAFGVLNNQNHYSAGAVVEWVIAFIFTFYVWSFAIDFIPALETRQGRYHGESQIGMAEREADADGTTAAPPFSMPHDGRYYANGTTHGANGYTSGVNGYKPPPQPSRNF